MDRYVGPPGSEAGVTNSVCLGFKRVVRLCGTAVGTERIFFDQFYLPGCDIVPRGTHT